MKMRTLAVGAAFLGMFSSAAVAADMYVAPEETPMVHGSPFSGFYMGVHGGYGWSDRSGFAAKVTLGEFGGGDDFDEYEQDGFLLGAHAGGNYVFDSGLLIGAEVSGSYADIEGSVSDFDDGDDDDEGITYNHTYNAIALAQGKLGWAFDRFAIYASGGFAIANSETNILETFLLPSVFKYDSTDTGWTVGAGADFMVTNNVSVGAAYNYIDFDTSENFDDGGIANINTFISEVDGDMHMIRLKLDYHVN